MTRATFECRVPAGMTAEGIAERIRLETGLAEQDRGGYGKIGTATARITVEIPATLTVKPDPNWKPRTWEQAAAMGGE